MGVGTGSVLNSLARQPKRYLLYTTLYSGALFYIKNKSYKEDSYLKIKIIIKV